MVRLKGCRFLSKELIEPLPHRKWGLKDRLVQGGTSECDMLPLSALSGVTEMPDNEALDYIKCFLVLERGRASLEASWPLASSL